MVGIFIASLFCGLSSAEKRGVSVPEVPKVVAIPYEGSIKPPAPIKAKEGKVKRFPFLQPILDSLKIDGIIPAGDAYGIQFNYSTESLEEIPPSVSLTSSALEAIDNSPLWLQKDLLDNLRRLSSGLQDSYANEINSSDTLYRDEIAFQIAHLSPKTLQSMDVTLPGVNAQALYTIAPDLQYVELVEYDEYTTTKYRVINGAGDTVWTEIPKEIYYWWVLMPKLSDEEPLMDASVYNEFWRSYIYNNADTDYPLLKDVLADVKVVWDGQKYKWANKDSLGNLYEFGDSLFAIQTVGRWVAHTLPEKAANPRPNQPNQLLHDHDGNCGELQDLLNGGARTALLPVLSVSSWAGDHVWCEMYCPDSAKWAYYQIDWECGKTRINFDRTYPNKGCITGWRADGYRWMVNEHYNPVCTLTVIVRDDDGKGIDGAEVVFAAAPYSDPHGSSYYIGSWMHTDENGELTVLLGVDINYGIRADWSGGHDPAAYNSIYPISYSQVVEGGHLYQYLEPGGSMPDDIPVSSISDTSIHHYSIVVEYELPYRTLYGAGYWEYSGFTLDDHQYADKREHGRVDFFICDEPNYNLYVGDSPFNGYEVAENSAGRTVWLQLPADTNFYAVLSGEEKNCLSQAANIAVYLYEGDVGVSELEEESSRTCLYLLGSNPLAKSSARIAYTIGGKEHGKVNLSVYDCMGRNIKVLAKRSIVPGHYRTEWYGCDEHGREVANGIYFIKLETEKTSITRKLTLIR